ncbi:aspartyl-phosphate phosphatase Spo0E family protein [Maledivibacter halophilus]|uniref:Spo0E like sporulation regulatory protein n=1 Tax=Maledivibacter halophilus TaxID=36842 RepID=A0A1T5L7X2_9FIRM|nr:aspartyl-phosphate phosphatase Spo0E family protein [Maledivibacter halophilus]SKC72156.1 Spo0E like sporulation regulatory protein [Maledivibacter halophilus]
MKNHNELRNLIIKIDETKAKLYELIQKKQWDLLDSEVIKLSQLLDELLSEYYHIKK